MAQATLTSKGQITIPKDIREALELQAGDKVEFTIMSDHEAHMKPVTKRVDEVFGKLHKSGRKPVSVQKMNDTIKQKMGTRFK